MAEEKKESHNMNRRQFVVKASVAVTAGVVGGVMGNQLLPAKAEATVGIPKSGHIEWDRDKCASCSRCLMACAVYHESAIALQLSRIKWVENDYLYGFRFRKPLFCKQCDYPECYHACPEKDKALCIDSVTGARYINKNKCIGCELCVEACVMDVGRINFDVASSNAIKCDLCMGRKSGPVCVEVCDKGAPTLMLKD